MLLHSLPYAGRPAPQGDPIHVVSRARETGSAQHQVPASRLPCLQVDSSGFSRSLSPQISTWIVSPGPPTTRAHAHKHVHTHAHSNRYGFKWTLMESHPLTAPTPLTCQAVGQLCRSHSRSAVSKQMPGVIPPPPCRPDLVVSPGKRSLNSPPSHCLLASPWTGCLPVTGAGPAGREGARWPGQSPRACSQALSF